MHKSHAANLNRISAATGVSVATLQAQRASTGLGWGSLEKAHLLANTTGQSFDDIVALHRSGQGWGKIARNNGVNLGTLVSNAHRSSNATMNAKNTRTMRGKSGTRVAKGRRGKKSTTRGIGHGSSGLKGSHNMRSMGRVVATVGSESIHGADGYSAGVRRS
jgi:hypothetical protein